MDRSRTVRLVLTLTLLTFFAVAAPARAGTLSQEDTVRPTGVIPLPGGTAHNFQLFGQNTLLNRGMNAGIAMYDHYVYVGSRTDGTHPLAGVMIVDVANPGKPKVVGQIGPPREDLPTLTSRELRVWPQQKLLIVMHFQCSAILHACASPADVNGSAISDFTFYDLTNPASPKKVAVYTPSRTPHEMFLWVDPVRPGRALLYWTSPTSSTSPPNLVVTDLSHARQHQFPEIVKWNANLQFSDAALATRDVRLHSIGLTPDGTRTYLAYLGGGFLVLDTSELAHNVAVPQVRLVSVPDATPIWNNMTVHSAVRVPGRNLVLTTDEIYGDLVDPLTRPDNESGCPWGWMHLVDITNEARPRIVGEYKLPQNDANGCGAPLPILNGEGGARGVALNPNAAVPFTCLAYNKKLGPGNTVFTSFSSHNPTVLANLAFITWHSGGFQAISIPASGPPVQAGWFKPRPLTAVLTEDPALSLGKQKVVMWSYPIIKDGLIYTIDIRNGLYILRYTGPNAAEVENTAFAEGNSNVTSAAPPA